MTPVFPGTIHAGKCVIDNPDKLTAYLHRLEGQRVELTIEKTTFKRSGNQNRYYWGVCLKLIADHTGHSVDDIHELMKSLFLKQPIWIRGKFIPSVRSSTRLDTLEFEDYLEKVRRWAQEELGVTIPMPGEVAYG